MSDRIALLEQRVAELERESAAHMAIIVMLLSKSRGGVEREAWEDAFDAAAARWGEIGLDDITRTTREIIGAALRQGGRPDPSQP